MIVSASQESEIRHEYWLVSGLLFWEVLVKYRVRLEKTDEGCAVWCPGLPGCWSQGETEEEALENIKDAIETYLATIEELTKDKVTRLVEVSV